MLSKYNDVRLSNSYLFNWIGGIKVHANAVYAVSLVRRRRVALPLEDVSKMTSTVRAYNLDPLHSKCAVRVSCHSSWEGIEECWPAAAGLELVLGFVQRCVAAGAGVDAL